MGSELYFHLLIDEMESSIHFENDYADCPVKWLFY